MCPPVHILATCRAPELLPYTELVLQTLRLGFPTAPVTIWNNGLPDYALAALTARAEALDFTLTLPAPTIHHQWIENLLGQRDEPFILCDTDLIFYENFEPFLTQFQGQPLAGYRIPEWHDDFSGCLTRARLHTSLLYVDPVAIKKALLAYHAPLAETVFTPRVNLIHPLVLPCKRQACFHDTSSLLYHAVGGLAFTDEMKDTFFHAHFGTIPDVVLPRLPADTALAMAQARAMILENPARGHGQWRTQDAYYANRQS